MMSNIGMFSEDGKEYIIYCQGIDESDFLMILDGFSE